MNPPIPVRNPRTGAIDAQITPPSSEALTDLCDRLRQAQPAWHKVGLPTRIETLQDWRRSVMAQREALIQALTVDTGRHGISVLEVDSFLGAIDRWCRLAPELVQETEKPTSLPFIRLQQALVPYPLVGFISPWNFPLLLSTIDLIPALLAGCAAIVKPSEITPRFVEPLIRSIQAVPRLREVVNVVVGAAETGAALIDQVDLIGFTGSVATGRKVGEAAAKRLIPAFLELGGKDPAIVLESADLEQATSAILWGGVVNTGQSCLSIERIYVAESVLPTFVEKLVTKAQALNLAYPELSSGEIGPIIAARQATVIADQLAEAYGKGAIAHCGGQVEDLDGGFWCRPTVLTGVDHSMRVMTEETFGPILPVMPFATVEQAVHLANDTVYGLSAAVFAGTQAEALAVGRLLQAGAVSINDAALTAILQEGEKQAFKYSGLGGSRMGPASLKRFLRQQAFLIKTSPVSDPWWFS